jgi:hypothetical protein
MPIFLNPDEYPSPPNLSNCLLPLYRWKAIGDQDGNETDLGFLEGRWYLEAKIEGEALFPDEFDYLAGETAQRLMLDESWQSVREFPYSEEEARRGKTLPPNLRLPVQQEQR